MMLVRQGEQETNETASYRKATHRDLKYYF